MKQKIVAVLIFSLFLVPTAIFAQDTSDPQQFDSQIENGETVGSGLVPCSGTNCSACHLAELGNTIVGLLIGLVAIVFATLMVVAGFRLVTSGGNRSARDAAKSSLTNAVVGLLLILGAWLLVDTLMRALVGDGGEVTGYGPWTEISCWEQRKSDNILVIEEDEFDGSGIVSGGVSVTPVGVQGMVSLRESGLNVASWNGIDGPGRTDKAHPSVAQAILRVQNAAKINGKFGFQVTAAYTDGVGHSNNSQHYRGTAVDIQPTNGQTKNRLAELCRQAGFSYVLVEARHVHCDMR